MSDAETSALTLCAARERLRFANSYTRLSLILEMTFALEWSDWLTLLGEEWEDCDNIGLHLDELLDYTPLGDLLDMTPIARTVARAALMRDAEQQALAAMPDKLTIYRGCYKINRDGLSWTLDRAIAERFPTLHRYKQDAAPLLLRATIAKADVLALKLGRDEAEVIALPSRVRVI